MSKKNKKQSNKVINTILSNIFIWIVIVVVAFSVASNFSTYEKIKEVTYNEYKDMVENKEIESATLTGTHFKGRLHEAMSFEDINGSQKEYNFISIELPESTIEQTNSWVENGIEVDIDDFTNQAGIGPKDIDLMQAYDDYPIICFMQLYKLPS